MPKRSLTLDELGASLEALGGFEARPSLAVAVSGGPDSMALAILADRWARQRGGRVSALTVDHGLRPESAKEAGCVASWLAARGIAHEILVWVGAKPTSGIQEAAREARYSLLAEWCRRHHVLHLLTAHQREDQVETHLIRRRAGSGIDGLAGMPTVRELVGCRLVRPLLSVPRARLLAVLDEERQPFLRDPSNQNPVFERARLRIASELPGATLVDNLVAELGACARQRIAREGMLDRLLARAVALHPAGWAALDPAIIAALDAETAERLLGRLAAAIGVARYPARRARLARLRADLLTQPKRARTLGGCRFLPWRGRLLVLREPAAASPPMRLEPGVNLVWDRRFAVALPASATSDLTLGYLGANRPPGKDQNSTLPRLLYPVLPAFWDDLGLVAVPHLGFRRPEMSVLPRLSFRPASPLTRAVFTVV